MGTPVNRRPLWQRVGVLLALVVVLLGVNALYPPVVTGYTTLTDAPGEVIYAAGFDGFFDEWEQYPGRVSAEILEGVMRLERNSEDFNSASYALAAPVFRDFDVRVTATAVDGPVDNGFGLVFRLQRPRNPCTMPMKLLCDLAEIDLLNIPLRLLFRAEDPAQTGYYMFLISSDGYYALWRMRGTAAERVTKWLPSAAIQTGLGARNQLRIVARGDQFQFAINGIPVSLCIESDDVTYYAGQCLNGAMTDVFVDDRFSDGQIGVAVLTTLTGGSGVAVEFDDVIVTVPANGSETAASRA